MELSKSKILIASNGEKTYAILNGVPLLCESLSFRTDGIDAVMSVENSHLGKSFTEAQFFDFVENTLGYKLGANR